MQIAVDVGEAEIGGHEGFELSAAIPGAFAEHPGRIGIVVEDGTLEGGPQPSGVDLVAVDEFFEKPRR